MDIPVCVKCGVPLRISKQLCWHDNGVISLAGSPDKRWVFFESDNIDNLFIKLAELIGIRIDRLVIESRRRGARKYLETIIPSELREYCCKERDARAGRGEPAGADEKQAMFDLARSITLNIYDVARIYGYGDSRLDEAWVSNEEYPWRNTRVRKPYSLLMNLAESLGQIEAMEGGDLWIDYENLGDDRYVYRCYESEHPVHLEGRLTGEHYQFKPGEISHDRCPECGVPMEVSCCKWEFDDGVIVDKDNGRRFAIYGPHAFDSILSDLENELGDAIPSFIIEAQRQYTKKHWDNENWKKSPSEFILRVAVRGLGNVVDFNPTKEKHELLIQNPCMHLIMVGMVQGLVELARGWDSSNCDYELKDDGDLSILIEQ